MSASPTPAVGAARNLSLARKFVYAAILSLLAVGLVLGGCELVLRVAGVGYSTSFARREKLADGTLIYRENRWCTAPFFSAELVRRPQPMRLPATKPSGAFRIFVLGSSAAMGDPEASFSLARVLEKMLHHAYPEVRFEVVNAGITAVNSHVVRGIAEDCAGLQPDLFIVYEGNNEVIGPFGPSGVFAPFLRTERGVRAAVALKSTRTGQLIAATARALRPKGAGGAPVEWGGMEMFLAQRIAVDDSRLEAVRDHFRANLLAIARAGRAAGAETVVCTVATNQRTFAPFASLHRPDLGEGDLARWQQAFAAAEAAAKAGDRTSAEAAYRAALAIDDNHAELVYRLGQLALLDGRDTEARELLQRALDLDTLRFRTDSALNGAIRSLAGTEGTRIVDAAAVLAAASPHGICGDEFFYEHVHLTLRGTYELARTLLPVVAGRLAARGGVPAAASPREIGYDELRVQLGFTAYEQGMIAAEMLSRVSRPPFTGQSDHSARLELWKRRTEAAGELLGRPGALEGLKAAMDIAMAADPDDWVLARNAGMMLVARGAPADAVPRLERAVAWIDDDVDALAALATAHRDLGHAEIAEAFRERVRGLEPRHPSLGTAPLAMPGP
ncbi:MAG: tetratricopeptide repeat protein [Opitutaceae bacterium]|nr:tetratricopeptide repeat protein [Opitutaceae bacterium]